MILGGLASAVWTNDILFQIQPSDLSVSALHYRESTSATNSDICL